MRRFQTAIGVLLCALSAAAVYATTPAYSDWIYRHGYWYQHKNLFSWIVYQTLPVSTFEALIESILLVLSVLLGALSFYVIRFFVRIIRYVHNKTKP